jgi:cell division protein FtsI/penicillin-binding protein 2
VVNLDTEVHCENGYFVYKGRSLHDVHAYGLLRVEEVIAKSSNIGAAKIGIMMGEERFIIMCGRLAWASRRGCRSGAR